jgi:hypothetical protein
LDYPTSACPGWCSLLAIAGESIAQAGEHLSHYNADINMTVASTVGQVFNLPECSKV